MDFLDPVKKRKHRKRLFIGYGLMAILVSLSALILMFQTYGYDFDRRTGTVYQKGLVFLASQPVSAEVFINGLPYKDRTDTRFSVAAGPYDIELRAAGYRTWRREFNLEGGSIERLNYALLFPENIKSEEAQLLASPPVMTSQSPNRRWLIAQAPNQMQNLEKYDLNDQLLNPQNLALPPDLLTSFSGQRNLTAVEWSDDNRHLLLKHIGAGQQEFVIVDTETPAQSFNLNKLFKLEPAVEVSLRDKSHTELHFYNTLTKQLQTGEVDTRLTAPVADGLLAFKAHGDEPIIYVIGPDAANPKEKVIISEKGRTYQLREALPGSNYLLDIARYNDSWYFVVGNAAEGKVYVYKDPVNVLRKQTAQRPVPSAVLKIDQPVKASFSHNARFVSVQGGQRFAVFDAEAARQYRYEISDPLGTKSAIWMDGHRLSAVSNGQVLVWDYDGINRQTLVASADGFDGWFSREYDFIFTFSSSVAVPGRAALFRHDLEL